MTSFDPYRLLTAPWRALPKVIIIGAMKSGTSSLYAYLRRHPDFVPPRKKELHYWERSHLKPRLLYRADFPLRRDLKGGRITGEASPGYLYHPHVARAISRALPNVRLIAILRDPATRAYSHWRHNVRRKVEDLPFSEAVLREVERANPSYERLTRNRSHVGLAALQFGYVRRGYYAAHLGRYLRYFNREQLLVLRAEDFFEDANSVVQRCFEHVGLQRHEIGTMKPVNVGRRGTILDELATFDLLYKHFELLNQGLYRLLNVDPWWPSNVDELLDREQLRQRSS